MGAGANIGRIGMVIVGQTVLELSKLADSVGGWNRLVACGASGAVVAIFTWALSQSAAPGGGESGAGR